MDDETDREYARRLGLCPICFWKSHEGRTCAINYPFVCDGTKRILATKEEWEQSIKNIFIKGVRK